MYKDLKINNIINIFSPSIANLKCTPSDRQMYPQGYVYPRLGTPAIDHDILLWKRGNIYGIRGLPHKLLASYLQVRQQYTVVGGYRSSMFEITQGVPQGSSLGHLLFALYVNNLPKASAFNSTLFADDNVLSISSGNCIELQKLVNTELQKVDEWMRFNKSLNYSKMSYMLIGPRGKRLHDFTVKINDNTISQTNSTKCLGVYIDDKLTWSDHITNLEKTISRSVEIFYRIRHYLNERALKSLYLSIVYSHLQYAIGAWVGVGKTSLRRLNILHKKIIRAMTYISFRSKLDPLYKYLNLLKVDDIYNL